MERIMLFDVDSKMPNLALMKISAFHKKQGDIVGFHVNDPEVIYTSIIFSKNKHKIDGLKFFYPDAKIIIGGTGYDPSRWLPDKIEFEKPDYDLYPKIDYSLGFTTRGCDRNCYFCIVPKKEGRFRRWQHPREFYDERFDKIVFLDNNILLDREWFFEVMRWVREKGLSHWFTQGVDIRLLDEKVIKTLREVKHFKPIEFSWDFLEMEEIVRSKIKLLEDYGFNLKQEIQFYVYVNDDSEFESGLYRCNTLKELGTNAFLMYNSESKRSDRIKALQRWANRKWIFWKCDFKDYFSKQEEI